MANKQATTNTAVWNFPCKKSPLKSPHLHFMDAVNPWIALNGNGPQEDGAEDVKYPPAGRPTKVLFSLQRESAVNFAPGTKIKVAVGYRAVVEVTKGQQFTVMRWLFAVSSTSIHNHKLSGYDNELHRARKTPTTSHECMKSADRVQNLNKRLRILHIYASLTSALWPWSIDRIVLFLGTFEVHFMSHYYIVVEH